MAEDAEVFADDLDVEEMTGSGREALRSMIFSVEVANADAVSGTDD